MKSGTLRAGWSHEWDYFFFMERVTCVLVFPQIHLVNMCSTITLSSGKNPTQVDPSYVKNVCL